MFTNRLLLVTLLTVVVASFGENATDTNIVDNTTTTTAISTTIINISAISTTTISTTIETFTVSPNNTINSDSVQPEVVFEVVDDKGEITEDDPSIIHLDDDYKDDQMHEVDLTTFDESLDGNVPNDTKIETNAVGGEVPQIVFTGEDSEKHPVEKMKVIPIEPQIPYSLEEEDDDENGDDNDESNAAMITPEASTKRQTTTAATISSSTDKPTGILNTLVLMDGVILPTDDDDFFENTNETGIFVDNEPVTFWDHASYFVDRFANENPKTSIVVLAVLFSIVLLLIFLVFRECCKQRGRNHRQRRLTSVTADLYNTSSCSHRYSKVTLPDNKEVTMQLMSADNSSQMV